MCDSCAALVSFVACARVRFFMYCTRHVERLYMGRLPILVFTHSLSAQRLAGSLTRKHRQLQTLCQAPGPETTATLRSPRSRTSPLASCTNSGGNPRQARKATQMHPGLS